MNVTIFRDLPSEGSRSMELYADRLAAALAEAGCVVSPYAPPEPRLPEPARVPVTYFWRTVIYPLLATRKQGEINHVIDHSYGHLVNHLDRRRTVVTCHDVRPLVYPDRRRWYGLSVPLWRRAFRGTLRASHIIAGSGSTREDLLRHSSYPPERVTVVYYGVDHDTFFPRPIAEQERVRKVYDLADGAILLHVGHCGQRKNIETLLHVAALVRQSGVSATLVQVGGRFTPAQRRLLAQLRLEPWIRQIPFSAPADLPALYSMARVLVFPSWYEGFGLPAVEAMACGTPVVAADASALPEVVADAGLLVDPSDAMGFAHEIVKLLTDPVWSDELRRRGFERIRLFTWRRTSAETMQVYQRVMER